MHAYALTLIILLDWYDPAITPAALLLVFALEGDDQTYLSDVLMDIEVIVGLEVHH
jgi:hypothetical protein